MFLGLHSLSRLYSECLPRPLSPLTVWQFLVIFQDTPVTCHLLHGVSLTGRTSGPFSELPEAHSFFFFSEAHSLPSIILYCPRLFLRLTPTSTGDKSRRVAALDAQCLTAAGPCVY